MPPRPPRPQTVLLLGGSFKNLGDTFMLRTVVATLTMTGRHLASHWTTGSYEERAALGLRQSYWKIKRRPSDFVVHPILKRYGKVFGIVSLQDIDAVVDFRGYYLGGHWPVESAIKGAAAFRQFKKQGQKIVVLPQAYGPIDSPATKTAAREIVALSDLFYVRDRTSMQHLLDSGVDKHKLRLVRDITIRECARETIDPCCHEDDHGCQGTQQPYFCVVPNRWMVERTSAAVRNSYVSWLIALSRHAVQSGLKAIVLFWSKTLDTALGDELCRNAPGLFMLARPTSPFEASHVIKKAAFVLSSRYHASVSALSQGVPCIGTAWCHKYIELFKDFGSEEMLLPVGEDCEEAKRIIDRILCPEVRSGLVIKQRRHAQIYSDEISTMWREVDEALQRHET